jgi:hypothetical protein
VIAWLKEFQSQGGKARAERLTPRQKKRIAKLGGRARAAGMTPEERSASARKAARARWGPKRRD